MKIPCFPVFLNFVQLNCSKVEVNTLNSITSYDKQEVLEDYRIAYNSRQISLIGREEVLRGKAKFGIFGDGKEIPQLAMAKFFKKGDFRSGYYRDQTFMMSIGELNAQKFFAQLYAHTDIEAEPFTAGRGMNCHFSTRNINPDGSWKNLTKQYNSSADISPTAGQMSRLVGLAFASKLYRQNPELRQFKEFSINGNEVAFGTIGNASCAEGVFFEAINAAGVLQIPMLMSVWDDHYGISVPNEYQITKSNISEALLGFQRNKKEDGLEIFKVKGWDYPALIETYKKAVEVCRKKHIPVLVHVIELTQPQGHSTSGSHERYKSKERLEWEKKFDGILKMRSWIIKTGYATNQDLIDIEKECFADVKQQKMAAWKANTNNIKADHDLAITIINNASNKSKQKAPLTNLKQILSNIPSPERTVAVKAIKKSLRLLRFENSEIKKPLQNWLERTDIENHDRYSSYLYSQSEQSALKVKKVDITFNDDSKEIAGREILMACFDVAFDRNPKVFAIGEDVGHMGGVNQGFAGMQEKYGKLRVDDTGIRENTIVGQGIGAALRGLRPIIEIQYLDYIYYAIQPLTDDLACLHYRTKGGQKAPLIIRTRGHRLEGIWHSGSPIGMLLHSIRGIYVLVPRNMTKAAGFYNTMLQSDDTAIIIECLNGYRLKEKCPSNIGEFTTPLGVPEIIRKGEDATIVTYGSMCRIVMQAAEELEEIGISCEIIDVQTLLPFDVHHNIVESIKKTNRVIFADEDVPGGATAYMMQKVLDDQEAYNWLDSKPVCIAAKDHRPAYGSDGDYFSKPNPETIFDAVYKMISEAEPSKFPDLY